MPTKGTRKRGVEAQVYRTKQGLRWRTVSLDNGKKTGNGGQAYSRAIDMENAMYEAAMAMLRYVGRQEEKRIARALKRRSKG
jgi:hypothetical protein